MTIESAQLDQAQVAVRSWTARGVLQGVVGRSAFFAFGYLATIILARGLGPVDYGVYGVVMSVLLWIEQTSKSTIAPAAAILIPKEDHDPAALEQTALFLNFLLFILLFITLWFTAPLLADFFKIHGGADLFRLAALDLPLFGMYAVYRGVLLGHREFFSVNVADVLYSVAKLVAVVLLLVLWLSVPGALVANALASIGALLFVMSRLSIRMLRPATRLISPLVHFALPLGVYMLGLQTIATLDLWLLKWLSPGQEAPTIGIYVAARNVAIVPSVILMAVSDVLLPSFSHAVAKNDAGLARRYLQGGVRFLWIIGLPVAFFFILTAQDIMVLLYSASFGEGGAYLRVLILHALSLAFITLFASALSASGQPYLSGAPLFLLIPPALLLNIVLIPRYGAVGAAYASALTGLLGAIALGVLVYKRFGPLIQGRTFLNVMIAVALMAGVASQLAVTGPLSVLFYLGCLAIYGVGLVVLGEVTRRDLEPLGLWRSAVR
jgi:O-antigen/teichoic acid export membrane protein